MSINVPAIELLSYGSAVSFKAAQLSPRHMEMLSKGMIADVLKELGISIEVSQFQALSDLSPQDITAQFVASTWRQRGVTSFTTKQIAANIAVKRAEQ
jgi:hypothetical protein